MIKMVMTNEDTGAISFKLWMLISFLGAIIAYVTIGSMLLACCVLIAGILVVRGYRLDAGDFP